MKRYFITATGTGIGKTLVTCALSHQLRRKGVRVRALKPVISGYGEGADSDTVQLLAAQGLNDADAISPWRFAAPLSPDMAAEEEGRNIDFSALVEFCKRPCNVDHLLVEGVGGVMVPLSETHTVLDWMAALGWPVILVAGSYLGTISHTLAAALALGSAGLAPHTVVIAESEQSPVPLARLQATLARFLPEKTRIVTVARLDSSAELWKYMPDLTESLL